MRKPLGAKYRPVDDVVGIRTGIVANALAYGSNMSKVELIPMR